MQIWVVQGGSFNRSPPKFGKYSLHGTLYFDNLGGAQLKNHPVGASVILLLHPLAAASQVFPCAQWPPVVSSRGRWLAVRCQRGMSAFRRPSLAYLKQERTLFERPFFAKYCCTLFPSSVPIALDSVMLYSGNPKLERRSAVLLLLLLLCHAQGTPPGF